MPEQKKTLFFSEGNPSFEDCDACLLGVAFDENASFGKGAALAPEAIIKASHQIDIEDPLTGKTLQAAVHNFGILKPKNANGMIREGKEFAERAFSSKKFFLLLGGDHSVANCLLDSVPKGAAFVNFDAHLDLREEWQGKKMSHAAVSKRIFDKGFEQAWVGVRDMVNEEEMGLVAGKGLAKKIFYCRTKPDAFYAGKEFPGWMLEGNLLPRKGIDEKTVDAIVSAIGSEKVFLNVDVDCLDLRQGVETGVPVPFGLNLESLDQIIFEICRRKEVVGLSIAELIPDKNSKGQTVAAMLCYNVLRFCGLESR